MTVEEPRQSEGSWEDGAQLPGGGEGASVVRNQGGLVQSRVKGTGAY